jgi:hypothetical protein
MELVAKINTANQMLHTNLHQRKRVPYTIVETENIGG